MQVLADQIMVRASTLPEGAPIAAKSLLHLGTRAAVDQALSRLVRRGRLMRAGRGVYMRPLESRFGSRTPSVEKVVRAVSEQRGEVVALLKGTRNHVYPIEQFVDGRPARGLAAISALAGNSRIAWLWLSQENAALSGRKPIDVLKQDRVDEVTEVARAYFAA